MNSEMSVGSQTREVWINDIKDVIKFSEEKGRFSNRYLIVESDSPDCILKMYPLLKGRLVLLIQEERDSWRIFNGTKYSILIDDSSHRRLKMGEPQSTLSILSNEDKSIQLLPRSNKWSSWECNIVFSKSFSLKVSVANCNLEKNKNAFFLDFMGFKIPASALTGDVNSSNFQELLNVASRLPVDTKKLYSDYENLDDLFKFWGYSSNQDPRGKLEGVKKTFGIISNFYYSDPSPSRSYGCWLLASNSKSTVESVKVSVIFNKLFEKVKTAEEYYTVCEKLRDCIFKNRGNSNYYYIIDGHEYLMKDLLKENPEARAIKKASVKKKNSGAFNKIMNDLDFIDIDKEKYPLTHEAVHGGEIPLGTFFRKNGTSYFVYNDNWELWELMLRDYRETAVQIANSCSGRTTYEKDIMSYFYFTLYELPEYLEKYTGKKWKGVPKLVNTADELEPPKAGETGTAKTRSALTPIVDNEKLEVVVPYVSMRIGGYQTTYCYGLTYSVLKRGFSYMGNTVVKDVEEKLNGRDDYGLMFYTLTGSAQGRGYPTFLIIFEKLMKTTRVHFHRVHPMRSKGGDYNPVHNWTIGGYKWMVGNVNFERIKVQQGDLAFVEIENFPEGEPEKVNGYDSHMFETPVDYLPYTKKDNQNVIGYVRLDKKNTLNHTEHMTRVMEPGIYEIRQCRSWEANPKGVWSLRID